LAPNSLPCTDEYSSASWWSFSGRGRSRDNRQSCMTFSRPRPCPVVFLFEKFGGQAHCRDLAVPHACSFTVLHPTPSTLSFFEGRVNLDIAKPISSTHKHNSMCRSSSTPLHCHSNCRYSQVELGPKVEASASKEPERDRVPQVQSEPVLFRQRLGIHTHSSAYHFSAIRSHSRRNCRRFPAELEP